MKLVTIHHIQKLVIEVSDTCPTDSITGILDWIASQYPYTDIESLTVDQENEMVIVNVITTNNERNNTYEKWYNDQTCNPSSYNGNK